VLALAGGFAWFLAVATQPVATTVNADGIVVLTGGADRIETGLRLLTSGRAPRLLVSGVGAGVELADVARRTGMEPGALADRVTLGRIATSTRTNATETADWVARYRMHDLIVVTASFHMPRALVELHRALPGVALFPAPVPPVAGRVPSLRVLGEEYFKWLAAQAGLTTLAPEPRHATGPVG
jgi:uncharacterized SAM-binding protein YcdF (DUF218 family)